MAKILVVDDECLCAMSLWSALSEKGHNVQMATRDSDAVRIAESFRPDVLVTDWMLHRQPVGLELAKGIKEKAENVQVIFMSGLPSDHIKRELKGFPCLDVLEKPLEVTRLSSRIHRTISPIDNSHLQH